MRNNENELELDDAGRSGNEWSGNFSVVAVAVERRMLMEGSDDVVIKVTDRAGAQSAPFCNSIAIVR